MPSLRPRVHHLLMVLLASLAMLLGGLVAVPSPSQARVQVTGPVFGDYIVTLKPATGRAAGIGAELVSALGGEVTRVYRSAFRGFAITLPTAAVDVVRLDPRVATVEADQVVTASARQKRPPSWGLDRIDQLGHRLNKRYTYPRSAGKGVHIYVIDTGLSAKHREFKGRIGKGRNFVRSGKKGKKPPKPGRTGDCNGHGTHVSSTAMGKRFGVAKRATIHPLRVLDCRGFGTTSAVLAALDWLARHHKRLSVANLSLSSAPGASWPSVTRAVNRLVRRNVAVAIAAGNYSVNACRIAPARAKLPLTVGATKRTGARSGFSDYGRCVDLFAPGSRIRGALAGTKRGAATYSGTSMASPHVAGALAILRRKHPKMKAKKVQKLLIRQTTRGKVWNRKGSPNKLLRVRK